MLVQSPTKRDRTRNSLLVAVQELLLDPELGTLSVPQVISRAGVSQGTFYNYFDSLGDAIDAVSTLILVEHARVLDQVTTGAADFPEIISRSARQTMMLVAFRPDVGRLQFDSGLPVDRFIGGLRAHFHQDLVHGIEAGSLSVSDAQVASSVYAGALIGSCLDIHRGHLSVDAIPAVAHQLLRLLGVSTRKADRLTSAPQEFAPWRPLPLSSIQES